MFTRTLISPWQELKSRCFTWLRQRLDHQGPLHYQGKELDQGQGLDGLDGLALADFRPGSVWLVGAGPGDLGLLTLRAWQAIQLADVVVYDRLVSDAILGQIPLGKERYYVGKATGNHSLPQDRIEAELIRLAQQGKRVLRLKGGDPYIFGRGGEEALSLAAAGVSCTVVPGITAAAGCAASGGIPLTFRGVAQSCRLITGHLQAGQEGVDDSHWSQPGQTLVFYMGLANADKIVAKLRQEGQPDALPVAIVERGTQPDQRVVETCLGELVQTIAREGCQSPALLIVGEVVRLRQSLLPVQGQALALTQ